METRVEELKRKLRELKRLEVTLRFYGNVRASQGKLIWDDFFALKSSKPGRYKLKYLAGLERDGFKSIIDEYFYFLYFKIYQERGLSLDSVKNPNMLALLGLSPYATTEDIKSKFRMLAKKHHPDLGGDPEKFIELMKIYDGIQDN